jgi:hypothetical protein
LRFCAFFAFAARESSTVWFSSEYRCFSFVKSGMPCDNEVLGERTRNFHSFISSANANAKAMPIVIPADTYRH